MPASRIDGRLYDRLFDGCLTENRLAHMQILLENRMTPAEAATVAAHIVDAYGEGPIRRRVTWLRIERDRRRQGELVIGAPRTAPRYLRALHALQWAQGIQRQLALSARPPAPVARTWVRGGVTLYRSSVPGPRTLVLGFTGNLRGFMMPTHLFLQFVGDRPVDVLKLEVPRGQGYVDGVRPFSHDFPSTMDWLRRFAADGGYSRVVTVGTSGGGLPALLASAHLGVDAAFACGPARMNDDEMAAQLGAASALDVLARTDPATRTTVLYGEQSRRDEETVEYLAPAIAAVDVVRVNDAGHACLYDLVERHEFAAVVGRCIFGDAPVEAATVS